MKYIPKNSLKSAVFVAALLSTTGIAHANWTGSWDSNYGELRLVQEGERVYGDYAKRGYFEGRVSADGLRIRGTFQYTGKRNRNGYIEFKRSGDRFAGGWSWAKDGPVSADKGNWSGSLKNSERPRLVNAVGRSDYWADFWNSVAQASRGWANADIAVSNGDNAAWPVYGPHGDIRGDEWQGTFTTNHGELRLVQVGRRVYGEYAKRGYFEGCVHKSGLNMRGTFQYFKPRRKHGFIEFRMDGDGFKGSWTWTKSGPPNADSRINWSGARSKPDVAAKVYTRANEMSFADMWPKISAEQRKWVLGSDYYDSCDPPEVDYGGGDNPGDENKFPGEML